MKRIVRLGFLFGSLASVGAFAGTETHVTGVLPMDLNGSYECTDEDGDKTPLTITSSRNGSEKDSYSITTDGVRRIFPGQIGSMAEMDGSFSFDGKPKVIEWMVPQCAGGVLLTQNGFIDDGFYHRMGGPLVGIEIFFSKSGPNQITLTTRYADVFDYEARVSYTKIRESLENKMEAELANLSHADREKALEKVGLESVAIWENLKKDHPKLLKEAVIKCDKV